MRESEKEKRQEAEGWKEEREGWQHDNNAGTRQILSLNNSHHSPEEKNRNRDRGEGGRQKAENYPPHFAPQFKSYSE